MKIIVALDINIAHGTGHFFRNAKCAGMSPVVTAHFLRPSGVKQ